MINSLIKDNKKLEFSYVIFRHLIFNFYNSFSSDELSFLNEALNYIIDEFNHVKILFSEKNHYITNSLRIIKVALFMRKKGAGVAENMELLTSFTIKFLETLELPYFMSTQTFYTIKVS